jgi:hypothetical protein
MGLGKVTATPASFAGQYLLSVEVATVGDRLEFVHFEHFFGLLRHPSKLPTVVADVYDLGVTIRGWCSVSTATSTL